MRYRKTIKRRLGELAGVRQWLRLQAATVDEAAIRKMELAITEALTNVVSNMLIGGRSPVSFTSRCWWTAR